MSDSDRSAWRLDIFAVERDGARLVWTGPWPADGDPEAAAVRLHLEAADRRRDRAPGGVPDGDEEPPDELRAADLDVA